MRTEERDRRATASGWPRLLLCWALVIVGYLTFDRPPIPNAPAYQQPSVRPSPLWPAGLVLVTALSMLGLRLGSRIAEALTPMFIGGLVFLAFLASAGILFVLDEPRQLALPLAAIAMGLWIGPLALAQELGRTGLRRIYPSDGDSWDDTGSGTEESAG